MKVVKATVIVKKGCPDKVCLTFDLPSPFLCDKEANAPLFLSFTCSSHYGTTYVKKYFKIEPELIVQSSC